MLKRKRLIVALVCGLVWPLLSLKAAENIVIHALFENKAIVIIDGKRRVLTVGQPSPEGIILVDTNTVDETIIIREGNQERVIKLGAVSLGAIKEKKNEPVILWANRNGHFYAEGYIDGVAIRFLVDTGATTIALNSKHAKRIGLDYKRLGKKGLASTASGVVPIYSLKLTKVTVGNIDLYNVDAGVIEGSYPAEALLGMSFLGKLEMKNDGQRMDLTKKF